MHDTKTVCDSGFVFVRFHIELYSTIFYIKFMIIEIQSVRNWIHNKATSVHRVAYPSKCDWTETKTQTFSFYSQKQTQTDELLVTNIFYLHNKHF